MKHLVAALDNALRAGNHYGALAIALALPDICGWVEDPTQYSRARCVAWYKKYLQSKYTRSATRLVAEHVFLGGEDFYALRCAFLHEGRDEIADQKARQVLEKFEFVVPPKGWEIHRNQTNNVLQLQVDIFCRDIAEGVSRFLSDIEANPDAMARMQQLLVVHDINGTPLLG
jgi:hypothetical protein